MHMIIRALVPAGSREEALSNAQTVFEKLVQSGDFDYYVTFDHEEGEHTVAGRDRWGDVPAAVRADTDEGRELIEEGWDATASNFEKNMKAVRWGIENLTDEQVREESLDGVEVPDDLDFAPGFVRHYMFRAGSYSGPDVYLYSEYGEGIRRRNHLDNVLEGNQLWVVPADVHF
ncbi:hypothetical protein G3I44_14085 [Halogeometricum borinquense]|uniref:DUF7995 domain-containing protein n=1 Tax=Halogeometricum borinquense TaxID=60847 RepID=A0A6C0UIH3_9EURY|nr:hypothetical protein [Halogeometricum borinquense]QIB75316.1 hypothetical protein G3I44_14085 [Halogeometricum borinquense]